MGPKKYTTVVKLSVRGYVFGEERNVQNYGVTGFESHSPLTCSRASVFRYKVAPGIDLLDGVIRSHLPSLFEKY